VHCNICRGPNIYIHGFNVEYIRCNLKIAILTQNVLLWTIRQMSSFYLLCRIWLHHIICESSRHLSPAHSSVYLHPSSSCGPLAVIQIRLPNQHLWYPPSNTGPPLNQKGAESAICQKLVLLSSTTVGIKS